MTPKHLSAMTLSLALAPAAFDAAALDITLTPSTSFVQVGDDFDVTVSVSGAQDGMLSGDEVLSFGFDVDLSDAFVAWTGATVAMPPFAFDDSASFADTDVAGSADFVAAVTAPSFTLAVLDFAALAPGTLSLGIVSDLSDPNQGLIYFQADPQDLDASIPIAIAAAPLPGSALLLAAGLPWLRRGRHRGPG